MNPNCLYLTVDLAVLAIPLACSFDRKVRFVRFWPALFPAIAIMMALFIPWDIAFTERGIWGFNPDYLSGLWIAGIPLEEWLFFICIPYACLFTYESLKHYVPNPIGRPFAIPASALLAVLCASLAATMADRWYIGLTCVLTALLTAGLAYGASRWATVREWNHRLWFAYLPLLVPFILSNGVLTGIRFWQYPVINRDVTAIADQIVWYNNDHNLQLRIFSMPVDDLFYGFLMIAMTVVAYERIARRLGLVTGSAPAPRP
ncbi:MAG: lycopene cyclase domain-containing protein [Flavobacteriales bacterium]